jgi:predicted MPP superfamily phosphohydrolase
LTLTTSPPPKPTARAIGRRPRLMTFRRFLLALTVILHLPFAGAVVALADKCGISHSRVFGAVSFALGLLLFSSRMRAGMTESRRDTSRARRVADIAYYVHWCACLYTIIPAILESIAVPVYDLAVGVSPHLPIGMFLWTYVTGLAVCGYGILVRRRWFVVKEVDVEVTGLDSVFDGFRIAHLSDLHIGTHTPKSWGARWARAANRSRADIAVVTGDLVSSGTAFHEDIAEVVAGLDAAGGVFVSMGNHDYFGDGEPLVSMLGDRGVKVLRNQGVTLERGGKSLYLAGIDDTWTKRDDMDLALRERPAGAPVVMLAHDPERFREAAKKDVALTLSGHTHGGQIAVPFLSRWASLSHLTHHFHQGLYRNGSSTLYVHPGLGTTGPPMRLGVAPAVVILTLRSPDHAKVKSLRSPPTPAGREAPPARTPPSAPPPAPGP